MLIKNFPIKFSLISIFLFISFSSANGINFFDYSFPTYYYLPADNTQMVYTKLHNSTYIQNISVNETNWVFNIWNENNDYYIDSGGIQITNHFLDYWTHNVWCVWINTTQGYQRRCSDGMKWDWTNASDGVSWVELNGTSFYSEGQYNGTFKIRYYLADGYDRINIRLFFNNTGRNITDMYFGWLVNDIRVGGDEENDVGIGEDFSGNIYEYNLSSDLSLEFDETDMLRYYMLEDNITGRNAYFSWDEYGVKNGLPRYMPFKLNLTHSLFPSQYNTPVLLLVRVGAMNRYNYVYSDFWWVDVDWTESFTCTVSGSCLEPACDFVADCRAGVTCSYTCPTRSKATSSASGCSVGGCSCSFGDCGGTGSCTTRVCSYTCNANWFNDDGNGAQDGCENSVPQVKTQSGANNTSPSTGVGVKFFSQWFDYTGDNATFGANVSRFIFSWNTTSSEDCSANTWYNNTPSVFLAGNWTNYTETINSNCGGKAIAYRFFANDTKNRWNASNIATITVQSAGDTTKPIITVLSPINNTVYPNNSIWFNVTLNEAGSACLVNISNYNNTLTNSSGKWNKLNNTLSDGNYRTRFYCNDTAGNMNSSVVANFTIDMPPTFSNNQSQLVATYSPTAYSNFSITWNDNSGNVNAYLENNFTSTIQNTTMSGSYPTFTYNTTPLKASTYQYRFFANDSSGNDNATALVRFTINKATADVRLVFDKTSPIVQGTELNASCYDPIDTLISYTPSSETHCAGGRCWAAMYGGIKYVNDDGIWIPIQSSKVNLLDYFYVHYLQKDPNYDIIINDLRYKFINITLIINPILVGQRIPFNYTYCKKYDINNACTDIITFQSRLLFTKPNYTIAVNFTLLPYNPLMFTYRLGNSSTIVTLAPSNTTYNDTYVFKNSPSTNYGTQTTMSLILDSDSLARRGYFKWNTSSIDAESIESALFYMWYKSYDTVWANDAILNSYEGFPDNWGEYAITWNDAPCGSTINASCNSTRSDNQTIDVDVLEKWYKWDVTRAANDSINATNPKAFSTLIMSEGSGYSDVGFWAKESNNASYLPYLNITYIPTKKAIFSNVKLYHNGTDVNATENLKFITPNVGLHNYSCNITDTQNYTGNNISATFTVNAADAAFSIAMPSNYASWASITGTTEDGATTIDWISFNFTDIPQNFVEPYQLGDSTKSQNGSVKPIFYIDNTGNVNIDIKIRFSSVLPTGIVVGGNASCSGTYTSCQSSIQNVQTTYVTLADDLSQTDSYANITLYANVSSGTVPTGTGTTFYINGVD